MKIIKLLLIVFIFISSKNSFAQTGGINFTVGVPQGEFAEELENNGYGFGLHGTLWAPDNVRPFTVGLNFNYLIYGIENRSFYIFNTSVRAIEKRTNSLMNFHLLFQVSPFGGTVRPYAEGLVGGAYLFTESSIENEITGEDVLSSTNFDDFAWSYGAGGGLLIRVGKDMGDVTNLYLDLKVRYLLGTEAEYLKEGSIQIIDGTPIYQVNKSKTDMLLFSLGVVAYFN